jgi:hypothetical protein
MAGVARAREEGSVKDRSNAVHVWCPRLEQERPVEEHINCAYCYGTGVDVAQGDRKCFCDFEPGKDPVNFGFPEGSSRNQG